MEQTIEYYKTLDPENREAWEVLTDPITFQDLIDNPDNTFTEAKAAAARKAGGLAERCAISLRSLSLAAMSDARRNGVITDIIKIVTGTDISTVVEERAEAVIKQWLAQDKTESRDSVKRKKEMASCNRNPTRHTIRHRVVLRQGH